MRGGEKQRASLIHTVKGFDIVNKAEIHVFLELSCFLDDPVSMEIAMKRRNDNPYLY